MLLQISNPCLRAVHVVYHPFVGLQVDVPTIELVDLPGIQLYPQDLCEQTTELVKSYLQGDDTLVLCVVDATIPSLDSSVAVKMVRDADKLPSTILALTKADLIRDEESIVEHIFERVLSRSAESKELAGLAGCMAVVNRLHQDKVSLLEAEAAEEAIFNTLLEDPAEAYAPTTIQQQLRQNTTTAQLIAKLDRLFSEHIKQKWMPSVLESIEDTRRGIADQVGQLGLSPDELDPAQIIRSVTCEVRTEHCALHFVFTACLLCRQQCRQTLLAIKQSMTQSMFKPNLVLQARYNKGCLLTHVS